MATQEIQNEEIVELKEALITKATYPVIWIGENGFNITRYGKLLIVKPSYYADRNEMALVIPTIDFQTRYLVFKPDKWYIVAGGVYPDLLFVREIIFTDRNENLEKIVYDDFDFPITTKYLLASGIKEKTYGIIYQKTYSSDMFEPLQFKFKDEEIIAKLYPETFKIFERNGKLFIKYLMPKEDC
jgi:hypothetical protein